MLTVCLAFLESSFLFLFLFLFINRILLSCLDWPETLILLQPSSYPGSQACLACLRAVWYFHVCKGLFGKDCVKPFWKTCILKVTAINVKRTTVCVCLCVCACACVCCTETMFSIHSMIFAPFLNYLRHCSSSFLGNLPCLPLGAWAVALVFLKRD